MSMRYVWYCKSEKKIDVGRAIPHTLFLKFKTKVKIKMKIKMKAKKNRKIKKWKEIY